MFIKEKLSNIIFNEKNFSKINIYGAGDIAKNIILKNMTNFDNSSIEVYDSDPDKIGKFIGGIKIKKPEKILENTNKIYISAAQSYDDIYTSLLKMRVEGSRIVSGIFL